MPVSARLDLDPLSDVRVMDFSYNLHRDIDASGRPSGAVRGGQITMTIESTSETGLFEWMSDPFQKKKGKIRIFKDDQESSAKELEFEDAFIVDYGENFHWQGTENMLQTFTVSAKKMKMGAGEVENEWPA